MTKEEDKSYLGKLYDDVLAVMGHLTEFRKEHRRDMERSAKMWREYVNTMSVMIARVESLELRMASQEGDKNVARIIN